MSVMNFEVVATTDMRDSKGKSLKLVTVSGIEGTYEKGGLVITPEEFGLKSIDYIGMNNFFAMPFTDNEYDFDGTWTKTVDLMPTKVIVDGELVWKMIIFLYPIDSAELPHGTPMEFIPDVPISMIVIGSKSTRKTPRN